MPPFSRVVSKVPPTQAVKPGEDRSLPSSGPPTEQVVDLPGERSRQAPAAAARAQTRRACFRGFNPQVSGRAGGQRSAVAEPRQVPRTSPPRPGPAAPRTARPRVGASPSRPPSPTGSALKRHGPQPQPNGFPDAGSGVPRRLSPPNPAAPKRRKADPPGVSSARLPLVLSLAWRWARGFQRPPPPLR